MQVPFFPTMACFLRPRRGCELYCQDGLIDSTAAKSRGGHGTT